ncbi:MAG TPA: FHA domain-containing protein [Gemmatimonadales bacterium]|jgi:hypothetical protein
MQSPPLALAHGDRRWALGGRPISIGRLTECDVVLQGDKVSRRHACVVSTPNGPLLVDSSRHGTLVNGEQMQAPWLLAEGDAVKVGAWTLQVVRAAMREIDTRQNARSRSTLGKWKSWISRYGPSEVFGTVAAVGAASAVSQTTESTIAAAYAGSLAETMVFYGTMALRETITDAHQAGAAGKSFGHKDVLRILRNLILEFGAAEALDSALIRPFCMGIGIQFLGGALGAFVGKVGADLAFYGPVLTVYEWRLARTRVDERAERSRRTTAGGRQVIED